MINERNNYFHKPIVQLNWYANLNESTTMATSFYYSGGEGGGSGSAGSILWGNNGTRDYDATIARNMSEGQWKDGYGYESRGVLRGSRNNQYTFGIMSKLEKEMLSLIHI